MCVVALQAAVDASKIGVTIATRYSASRPQFGDRPILSYITQQRRLFVGLATAYSMHLAMLQLKQIVVQVCVWLCAVHATGRRLGSVGGQGTAGDATGLLAAEVSSERTAVH